jgi:hypothetical protein
MAMQISKPAQATQIHRAGFHITDWCDAVGFSRATYYNLPVELQPQSVRIGGRRLVIESPREYLLRVANSQQAAA